MDLQSVLINRVTTENYLSEVISDRVDDNKT